MCAVCDLFADELTPDETPEVVEVDRSITRVPFDMDDLPEGIEVRLYALASPLYGMFGEVADHVVGIDKPCDTHGREVAVYATNGEGDMVSFVPVVTDAEPGATIERALASFGFVDVTSEG